MANIIVSFHSVEAVQLVSCSLWRVLVVWNWQPSICLQRRASKKG